MLCRCFYFCALVFVPTIQKKKNLEDSTSSFIKKDVWPPNSGLQFHELQCMGFTFRESLQRKDDWFSEEELKNVIRPKWREISQNEV